MKFKLLKFHQQMWVTHVTCGILAALSSVIAFFVRTPQPWALSIVVWDSIHFFSTWYLMEFMFWGDKILVYPAYSHTLCVKWGFALALIAWPTWIEPLMRYGCILQAFSYQRFFVFTFNVY